MSRFIQVHILTSYPPANLNRDDLGRPKTAKMGGVDRLRMSSQSLKRNWRISDLFQEAMGGHLGTRTKMLGVEVYKRLIDSGVKEKDAKSWAQTIAGQFGKLKKESKSNPNEDLEIEQLVHVSQEELAAVYSLTEVLGVDKRAPEKEELDLLRRNTAAVDVALFGRMLASKPEFNVEASCQVAHAVSVHPIVIEDDYFTAVDDLNSGDEDSGAAHIGESSFAAGLFYSYICLNKEQLVANLDGNEELSAKAITALIEAAVKVAPAGKQNSFASRAYASYVLVEKGDQQPRSLAVSYLKPIESASKRGADMLTEAIEALQEQKKCFDEVYGLCSDSFREINVSKKEGSLKDLLDFVSQ